MPVNHSGAVEMRIEHIAFLMRNFRWRAGSSVQRLMTEWGLSDHYVRELAQEASKRVLEEMTDAPGVTRDACVVMRKLLEDTTEDLVVAREAKDWGSVAKLNKNMIDAVKTWATVVGIVQKHNAPASPSTLQFPKPADALAYIDEMRAEMVKRAELVAKRDVVELPKASGE